MLFLSTLLLLFATQVLASNVTFTSHSHTQTRMQRVRRAAQAPSFNLAWQAQGQTFLDSWDFFNQPDPTHGLVNYVDGSTARDRKLVSSTDAATTLKVDSWTTLAPGLARDSVRLVSKQKVKMGSLVVLDLERAPYGSGVWPAFWAVGDDWPNGGEIDIFEGVSNSRSNQYALHTSAGCTLTASNDFTGQVLGTNCDAHATGNEGCGIKDRSVRTFGKGINAAGGAVFATFWDDSGISMWVFLNGNVPKDLRQGKPTLKWGKPRARFVATSCDMKRFFAEQSLVINITLCGDWAGATFNADGFSGTCVEAVQHAKNFKDAEFSIRSVKVYETV